MDTGDLNNVINKLELIDVHRTQVPTTSNIQFLQVQMAHLQKCPM